MTARAFRLLAAPSIIEYRIPKHGADRDYETKMSPDVESMRASGALDVMKMLNAAEAAWSICNFFGTSPHFAIDPVELQKKADELAEWALVISSAGREPPTRYP